jgi:hypothetical protein
MDSLSKYGQLLDEIVCFEIAADSDCQNVKMVYFSLKCM